MLDVLLEVKELKKYFSLRAGFRRVKQSVHAVDGVSFNIEDGETLGLAGESGCGKTTLGRTILRLYEPTDGEVFFRGRDIFGIRDRKELRKLRREMQIVFQDPYSSLNPRLTVGKMLGELLRFHELTTERSEVEEEIFRTLEMVGLEPRHIDKYPHEFSGGQRQRIAIARALILKPKFIVADEPVSSLDVSVQATVLNLMRKLQKELKFTYLWITHDLSVIKFMSNRIAIMYLGKIVEIASKEDLFSSSQHPYTQALLAAVPVPNPDIKLEPTFLKGDVPTPINPPPGCRLHPRCPYAESKCKKVEPQLIGIDKEHYVACHLSGRK